MENNIRKSLPWDEDAPKRAPTGFGMIYEAWEMLCQEEDYYPELSQLTEEEWHQWHDEDDYGWMWDDETIMEIHDMMIAAVLRATKRHLLAEGGVEKLKARLQKEKQD